MDPSEAVEQRIRERVEGLVRVNERITSCHVTVEGPPKHQQQGNPFSVHVDLHIPNKQFSFGRSHRHDPAHDDVYVAIRDAFDAAERGLTHYAREHRAH
jgi:ribosome-associated translation inhibitor RaiA